MILGSSLLAAFIGAGASITTTFLTGRSNQQLEGTKMQKQLDLDAINRGAAACEQLIKDLDELSERMEGTSFLIQHAGNPDKDVESRISKELMGIGAKARAVLTSEKNSLISSEVTAQINRSFAGFLKPLSEAQADAANWRKFVDAVPQALKDIQMAKAAIIQSEAALRKATERVSQ